MYEFTQKIRSVSLLKLQTRESLRQKRWKIVRLEHGNIMYILSFLIIFPFSISHNSQSLQVIFYLLSTHFRASTMPIQASTKMWKQFIFVLSGQFNQFYSSCSLMLLSLYHCLASDFFLGFGFLAVVFQFVSEFSSNCFHADFLRTFWIEFRNLLFVDFFC